MKKFSYAFMAILIVGIVSPVSASWVDHNSTCVVATSSAGNGHFLTADGRVWNSNMVPEDPPAPVPVSQMVFWEYGNYPFFVDTTGNIWIKQGGTWVNQGQPPGCGPTQAKQSTWGELKAHYR